MAYVTCDVAISADGYSSGPAGTVSIDAGDGRIAVAGGASTINQALTAGLIDELRLHIAPFTLGAGERIFDGVPPLKLEQIAGRSASLVTHVTYRVTRS
jgi:dihydrofolate reductase